MVRGKCLEDDVSLKKWDGLLGIQASGRIRGMRGVLPGVSQAASYLLMWCWERVGIWL